MPLGLDDSWTGIRWVGGHGARSNQVYQIKLVHGQRLIDAEPYAEITTSQQSATTTLRQHLAALLWDVWHDQEAGLEALQAAHRSETPFAEWASTTVHVNSTSLAMSHLRIGTVDVMIGENETFIVSVISRRIDPHTIVLSDADLTRYNDLPIKPRA